MHTTTQSALASRLDQWMRRVGEAGFDGWLIADFRRNSPVFSRLLSLDEGILSRRCFLWLPAAGRGEPRVMASRVDGHTLSGVDLPVSLYAGFADMRELLASLLPSGGRVAMEYVPQGALPTVARVDAGLIELVRDCGVTVVSSGTLISALEVWSEQQQALHRQAARIVDEARRLALEHCGEALRQGERITEGTLVALINRVFTERGLTADHDADVAVNANAADPHYGAGGGEGAEITRDAVLLIDLSGKMRHAAEAPYADSTWMAYTGATPPAEVQELFAAVRVARDAAIDTIAGAARTGSSPTGAHIDRVARASLIEAGYEDAIMHRTGHSLGTDHVHGMGTNLDSVEFPDERPLLQGSGFTVEPGLYLPGRFGIRLEVSALLGASGLEITTETQRELTPLPA